MALARGLSLTHMVLALRIPSVMGENIAGRGRPAERGRLGREGKVLQIGTPDLSLPRVFPSQGPAPAGC